MNDMFLQEDYFKLTIVSLFCYLAFNGYYLIGLTSIIIKIFCSILTILFCSCMCFIILILCTRNIKSFFKEFQRLTYLDMNDMRIAYGKKVKLYFAFCFFTLIYYMGIILTQFYLLPPLKEQKEIRWEATHKTEHILEGIKAISSCVIYSIIALLFHPRLFTPSFRLATVLHSIPIDCK